MDGKKKDRVYFEDIKAKHTTHWDLDYLDRAELERLYRKNRLKSGLIDGQSDIRNAAPASPAGNPRRKKLVAVLAGATAALLAAVILLLLYQQG